jgi:hypothetical protein
VDYDFVDVKSKWFSKYTAQDTEDDFLGVVFGNVFLEDVWPKGVCRKSAQFVLIKDNAGTVEVDVPESTDFGSFQLE